MQSGYKKQHRRQFDPEGILPQYGGTQEGGFNPLGHGGNRLEQGGLATQKSGPTAQHQRNGSYLSPMTNAANHSRTSSASGTIPAGAQSEGTYPTGYPVPGDPQIVIRKLDEETENVH